MRAHYLSHLRRHQTPNRPRFRDCARSLEPLESRDLLSVAPLYYSVTGAGNNRANPAWGEAGTDLYRGILSSAYGDGVSSMNGQDLPSARAISNAVGSQSDDVLDPRNLSAFTYAWGQFIDHDLDLTPDGGTAEPIPVPVGDPQFDPSSTGAPPLPFTRSITDPATGLVTSTGTIIPLNQPTVITSFLDGSMIYGSDAGRAAALRTMTGGQLKTSSGNLLPFNTAAWPNANNGPYPDSSLYLAGDIRANENVELTSLQVLFMREHNLEANRLAHAHPKWTDEQLYQGARQIVIAEIQSITFNEFLPALLGTGAISPYAGYNPTVNPGITPEFSEAAYRFGHSQLDNEVQFLTNIGNNFAFTFTLPDGTKVPVNTPADIASGDTGISLVDAFFDPSVLQQPGVEGSVFKYLASDVAQAVDLKMVDSVRNVLFGAPGSGAGGQDLFALDIQRGRDVGLPTFNAARVAYGLPAVTSFSQITSDPALQAELQAIYGNVNSVELFVGGLAEDHAPNSSMGPTFQAIIANQFERIRDGDRMWYQNTFSGLDLRAIQHTTLADIIARNTTTTNLQSDVFVFETSISGRVLGQATGDPRHGFGGFNIVPLSGITVQLMDTGGNVIATTQTNRFGGYTFNDPGLGTFKVQVVAPAGLHSILNPVRDIHITRGGDVAGINFGLIGKLQSLWSGGLGSGPGGPSTSADLSSLPDVPQS
jgi:peroxidase